MFIKLWFKKKSYEEFGDIEIDWKLEKQVIKRFYHLYSLRELVKDIKNSDLIIKNIIKLKIISKYFPDNYAIIVTKF